MDDPERLNGHQHDWSEDWVFVSFDWNKVEVQTILMGKAVLEHFIQAVPQQITLFLAGLTVGNIAIYTPRPYFGPAISDSPGLRRARCTCC